MYLSGDIQTLMQMIGKLPGMGPRSARRVVLHWLKTAPTTLPSTIALLHTIMETHRPCEQCGYIDANNPCFFCSSPHRTPRILCIVADTGDVWALEKSSFFKGQYHVLGGTLSAFHGTTPDELNLATLPQRLEQGVQEVILALNGTFEGITTSNYLSQFIHQRYPHITISGLAKGIPVGGELDYLDQGTLMNAFMGRHPISTAVADQAPWIIDNSHQKTG
jgi:recombination protein RecR